MPPCDFARLRVFLIAVLVLGVLSPVSAQNVLCVEYKGAPAFVQRIHNGYVYVLDDGKLVPLKSDRCVLVPAHEFLPAYAAIRDIDVKTSTSRLRRGGGGNINNEFHFRGTFESPYLLPDAYLVLELDFPSGKRIFCQEIGTLTPYRAQTVEAHLGLPEPLGAGKYELHIFTGVREIFHSQQPRAFQEGVLDAMVAKQIAGVSSAPPKPYFGPVPEYPPALRKAGTKGEASVRIRITRTGVVLDPEVVSATDPAFGEAALVAARLWRFLPRVEDGRPVETHVTMPFGFEPPAAEGK